MTLNVIRNTHWIIHARKLVKSHISKCVPCVRFGASSLSQQMGNLPIPRVQVSEAFSHVGVDLAGPLKIKMSFGRGYKSCKGYIVVFICFCTKAIHLEAVTGYDTDHFMAAFKRFISRRGLCRVVYSDCGTNFVGACKEIKSIFAEDSHRQNKFTNYLAQQGIEWRFNPPAAPHFGGLWEAAVKSTKFHLKRVVGDHSLSYEELSTLLTMIEACLNSRPLSPISDDSTDLEALTPAHFLIGRSLLSFPEDSLEHEKISLNQRWKMITQMRDSFWRRWKNEYLQSLQLRSKWQMAKSNLQVDDLVLIMSELSPPSRWPLARVLKVHPGSDGLVRAATLRTASSIFERPVAKLILLPIIDHDVSANLPRRAGCLETRPAENSSIENAH